MKHLILFIFLLVYNNNINAQFETSAKNTQMVDLMVDKSGRPPVKIPSKYHDVNGNLLNPLKSSAANIIVNYGPGFTPESQAAFQYAVDIWESILISNVTIEIDATWEAADNPDNLGSAGTNVIHKNNSNFPFSDTWYPASLANALADTDLSTNVDISANFNSGRNDWYFGTDGNPPNNTFDLVTIALHEIGHGIGFLGSGRSDGTVSETYIKYESGSGSFPIVWDRFIENGSGTSILNFGSQTTGLLNQLTGNNLFFNGTNANNANSNSSIKIYAPSSWNAGSSFSHQDETTFPNGLMTPFLSAGSAIHDPGAIVRGILQDIGWEIDCEVDMDLTVNNSGSAIASGNYVANNSITTQSTRVATGTAVVFRATNFIEIKGTAANPFIAEGSFIAHAGGAVCNLTTYSPLESVEDLTSLIVANDLDKQQQLSLAEKKANTQPVLYQNYPNPFSSQTTIEYYIPDTTEKATIFITNINGQVLKKYPIQHKGEGTIILQGKIYEAGMCWYALQIDGNVVDNKKMVLLK